MEEIKSHYVKYVKPLDMRGKLAIENDEQVVYPISVESQRNTVNAGHNSDAYNPEALG